MPKDHDAEAGPPRRDGLYERRGTWGQVVVGAKILGNSGRRGDVWEIIDSRTPDQIRWGESVWYRARSLETGEEATIPPRMVNVPVTFVMESPTGPLPPRTPVSDAEQIALLVEELGATVIATRDNETGEIHCPNYDAGKSVGDNQYGREEAYHLRIAHNIDASGMNSEERAKIHRQAHNAAFPQIGKTGFPHRHVPEDHTLL